MNPRGEVVVDAARFAAARAKEIKTLSQEISAGPRGHKRAMQLLPHHKQRREMSSAPKRLPRRLREQGERELAAMNVGEPEPKKHRKHRRRPRYLLEDHARRQRDFAWLETHIWHAKRFKMVKAWGFHLAKHPRDRAGRAAYKALRRACVLYDASFERVVRVRGAREAVAALLRRCVDPSVSSVDNTMYTGGSRMGTAMLHHPDAFPRGCIGPVRFVWRAHEMLLLVHPAAADELAEALQQCADPQVTVDRGTELVMFDVLGPTAHRILQRLVQPQDPAHPWRALEGIGDAAALPANVLIAVTAADPRLANLRSGVAAVTGPPSVAMLQQLVAPGQSDAPGVVWDADAELVAPEPQAQLDARRGKGALPEPRTWAPAMLVQRPARGGLGAGYRLVLPRGWAMAFWTMLNASGAHSVGLQDMELLQRQELGLPVFPADYPETRAGQAYWQDRSARLTDKWLRRPPAKRSPFFVGDDCPFVPSPPPSGSEPPLVVRNSAALPPPGALVPVTILMEGRGALSDRASIYADDGSTEASLFPATALPACNAAALGRWTDGAVARDETEPSRIGFANGGGVSMLRGMGHGVGLVDWSRVGPDNRVWVRNLGGPHRFAAIVKRL